MLSACIAAGLLLGGPAAAQEAAETIDYAVEIEGAPSEEIEALVRRSLRATRFEDEGAASLALLGRRAEADLETIRRILRAEGYYDGDARSEIAAPDEAGEDARLLYRLEPGAPYTLAGLELIAEAAGRPIETPLDAAALGAPIGERARAAAVLAGETAAVAQLRRNGRPYAALRGREATADLDAKTLRVRSVIDAGPRARFGPLRFEGATGVDEAYLRSYQTWEQGAVFDDEALTAFQRALSGTGLFRAVTVAKPAAPPDPAEAGALPVAVTAERAPERTVRFGARYSTDIGPSARAGFEHRNLFGANERLAADLTAGLEGQSLDLELRKPQFRRYRQALVAALGLRRLEDDAFDELGATASLGVERALGRRFGAEARIGLGVLGEASLIEDALASGAATEETSYLIGLPAFAALDARDDPLDPTTGWRLRAGLTPFAGSVDDDPSIFLSAELEGAAYQALDPEARFVLAGRGRIGAIFADALSDVPAPRRLFSGGGGSVRGYADRFVGPLDAAGDPIGGRSALELGAELRFKATAQFGAVLFAEAGAVGENLGGLFEEDLQVGVGPGLRYYSPIGPVGVDVGLPIDPRPEDDPFQLYFFIGQAF